MCNCGSPIIWSVGNCFKSSWFLWINNKHCFCPCFCYEMLCCAYCIVLCFISLYIVAYFSYLCAWFTFHSSVHASILHLLLAHHHLCYVNDWYIWFNIYVSIIYVVQLKCHGIFLNSCLHWSPSFAIFDFGVAYIDCVSSFLFASDALFSLPSALLD